MSNVIDNSINALSWGEKIEAVRIRLHIVQTELCAAINMSHSTYQKIKKGAA